MNWQEMSTDRVNDLVRDAMHSHDEDVLGLPATTFVPPERSDRRRFASMRVAAFGTLVAAAVGAVLITSSAIRSSSPNSSSPQIAPPPAAAPTSTVATGSSGIPPRSQTGSADRDPFTQGVIYSDGTIRFRGVTLTVPREWVHASYATPCGDPITDYAMILTEGQEVKPSPDCLNSAQEQIEGILVVGMESAPGSVNSAAGRTALNGSPATVTALSNGKTLVVMSSRKVKLIIDAPESIVSSILKSVRYADS